jgi:hypothetical protein
MRHMRTSGRLAPLVVATTLALGLTVSSTARVAACSCAAIPDREAAVELADVAFVGFVVESDDVVGDGFGVEPGIAVGPPGEVAYTFQVTEALKAVEDGRVVVTSDLGTTCGVRFNVAELYRVHAVWDGGRLTTGLCSGNEATGVAVPVPQDVEPAPPLKRPPERVGVEPAGSSAPASEPFVPVGALLAVVLGAVALSAWAFKRRPGSRA